MPKYEERVTVKIVIRAEGSDTDVDVKYFYNIEPEDPDRELTGVFVLPDLRTYFAYVEVCNSSSQRNLWRSDAIKLKPLGSKQPVLLNANYYDTEGQ